MHPRIAELFQHLDRCRATLAEAVDAVPAAARDTRPAPDRWSVAEVLEHLGIIEGRLAGRLSGWIADARAAGLRPEHETTPVVSGRAMAIVANRERAIESPEAARPRAGVTWTRAWDELTATRAALKQAMLEGDGLALGEISYPHPVLGPLTAYEWIATVGGHEVRHAAQIREVGAALV